MNSKVFRLWALSTIAVAMSLSMVLLIENVLACTILAVVYVAICVWFVRANIFHPMAWFLVAILFYHYSLPVLHVLDVRTMYAGSDILLISWTGLVISSLIILAFERDGSIGQNPLKFARITNKVLWSLFLVSTALMVVLNIAFVNAGFGGKRDASLAGFNVWVSFSRWFLLYYAILLIRMTNRKVRFPLRFVIPCVGIALLTALNIGERDVFFGFALVTLFIYFERYRPSKIMMAGLLVGLALLIPILGAAKNIFVREVGSSSAQDGNIVISLLDGEFRSASYNLDTIVSRSSEWDYFMGETVLWAIGRSVVPAFIYSGQNAVGWYNENFHPEVLDVGGGYGFSYAAEGFINFGYLGVGVWFAFLSGLIVFFYNKRRRSDCWWAVYCVAVPLFIYVLRADLSNFLSPMIKGVAIPLAFASMVSFYRRGAQQRRTMSSVTAPNTGKELS